MSGGGRVRWSRLRALILAGTSRVAPDGTGEHRPAGSLAAGMSKSGSWRVRDQAVDGETPEGRPRHRQAASL